VYSPRRIKSLLSTSYNSLQRQQSCACHFRRNNVTTVSSPWCIATSFLHLSSQAPQHHCHVYYPLCHNVATYTVSFPPSNVIQSNKISLLCLSSPVPQHYCSVCHPQRHITDVGVTPSPHCHYCVCHSQPAPQHHYHVCHPQPTTSLLWDGCHSHPSPSLLYCVCHPQPHNFTTMVCHPLPHNIITMSVNHSATTSVLSLSSRR
jgi:hypothetical protein